MSQRLKGASRKVRRARIEPPDGAQGDINVVGQAVTTILPQKRRREEQQAGNERVRLMLSGLSGANLQVLQDNAPVQANHPADGHKSTIINVNANPEETEWVDLPDTMQSDSAFVHALRDIIDSRKWSGRWTTRKRSWKHRRQEEISAWNELIEPLADTLLKWQYQDQQREEPSVDPDISEAAAGSANDNSRPLSQPQQYIFDVYVYCVFTLANDVTVYRVATSTSPALDILAQGYVAATPREPNQAVSVKTLKLLHALRLRKPSLSVEAFTKVVCDFYQVPYRSHFRQVFANTYEVYVRLLRVIDKRVRAALGWDSADWRVLNACRACCYKLEDEPELAFSRMYAIDGNNSLKRMKLAGARVAADERQLEDSDYYLSKGYVDRFANEVRGRRGPALRTRDNDSDASGSDAGDDESVEGDPTDGLQDAPRPPVPTAASMTASDSDQADPSRLLTDTEDDAAALIAKKLMEACVKNWKANTSDEAKKMWSIFEETGVFVSACRHGTVLWIIDMVRSGELAKYPLAIVAKVLETFDEKTIGGYDIGCSFEGTIKRSSLGGEFARKKARMCVNAFHGYTHCYPCQLHYHPNVITGIGLEDLETLERIFSASNQLASITRYMSAYRRRLYIEAFFQQWDEDKYANSGTFILNNYKQALSILQQDAIALRDVIASLGVTEEQMIQWEKEELTFFATLGDGEPYDVRKVVYVEMLQEFRALDTARQQANVRFCNVAPEVASNYGQQVSGTRRQERDRRYAREKLERVSLEICELEIALEIAPERRWTPDRAEYQETLRYIQERRYRRALDKLQKLVIQRLFELHKLNLAQTGYKLRTHLAKSLQVRCKAIRNAVTAYNAAAAALTPPRDPLDWSKVSHYGFLEEFILLQDTRNDIRSKPWARPEVREAMKLRRRVVRAKEEIMRCNIEIRRLHTVILDEKALFRETLTRLKDSGSLLYGAVREYTLRRGCINDELLRRVHQVYALDGFTGTKGPGIRLGGVAPPAEVGVAVPPLDVPADGEQEDDSEEEEEDQGDIGGLVQFVSHL